MMRAGTWLSVGLAAVALVAVTGCGRTAPPKPTPAAPQAVRPVLLEVVGKDRLFVTITNVTKKPYVFSDRFDHLMLFHQSPTGKRSYITMDPAAAKTGPIGPFSIVWLDPDSSYRMEVPRPGGWYEYTRPLLLRPGEVFAVLKPLRPGWVDERHRSAVKDAPCLRVEMASNRITTPLPERAP